MTTSSSTTPDLSGFTNDLRLGGGRPGSPFQTNSAPALAHLSTGGFVAVWQGPDTVAGGAGAGLWAQLRDASGGAAGSAFALTPNGDARIEGEPAVTALANGRFAVAYSMVDGGMAKIAYRVVDANGTAGSEHILASGAAGDTAMPAVATLADGGFAIAWRAGGAVHVQGVTQDGALSGGVQNYATLGSAFSPSLAPLAQGGYVVSWGEMNDGNVYAATSSAHTLFVVSGDGDAASLSTAAPLPHVAALAGGGFVVAWDSYVHEARGFTISDVFFQRYDASGHALGAAVQANVASGGRLFDAAVTGLSNGGFLVAWQGADGDGDGIHGRRFGADGSAVDGQDLLLNAQTGGSQTSPDVAALGGGGFAAAWIDTAADGSVSVEARVLPGVPGAAASAPATGTGAATTSPAPAGGGVASAPVTSAPVSSAPVSSAPSASAPVSSAPVSSAPAPAAGAASLAGGAAGDVLHLPAGTSNVDGGGGIDTLLAGGKRAASTIVKSGAGFALTDNAGHHATLVNVERIQFSDGDVALDVNGNGGQAYRLYQAAFNRAPDKAGLGYWIAMLDKGLSLQNAGASFASSAEFGNLYGAHATDAQFVQALYQNVLHRAPDSAGVDFWMQSLHTVARGQVLANFSESAENQAQVIGSIQNGIDFLHWT